MPGPYFDQLSVGQVFHHSIRRTVTEMDNVLFSALTHAPAPLHIDEEYCRTETEFGTRILNSAFTLGLVVGVSVADTSLGTTLANLGWDDVQFPRPVIHGDTLRVRTTVADLRESESRPGAGIATFLHEAFNQRDEPVAICKRVTLMKKQPSKVEAALA